jgi:heme exporter protein B
MIKVFFSVILNDMRVILNSGTKIFMPIIYLSLILIFFSISLANTTIGGYDKILPQIIWLSCLLVSLLNMETLFKEDYEDGTLEGLIINSHTLEINVLAKIISYWLFTIIPLVIVGFFANYLLTSNIGASLVLLMSLLLGTLTISLIGSIAAALTLSIKGNNLLLSTIVLPMDIPVLIFGTNSVYNAASGVNYDSELLFLLILLLLFLIISPFASALGLRNSLD